MARKIRLTIEDVREELQSRISYSYSSTDLANDTGISRSHLSEILSGKKNPSTKTLEKLGYVAYYIPILGDR